MKTLAFLAISIGVLTFSVACGRGTQTGVQEAAINRGKVLYENNCVSCHGGSTGGSPSDVPPPHNANGHTWHHADQQIIDIVLNGAQIPKYEWKMPEFGGTLSEGDVIETDSSRAGLWL